MKLFVIANEKSMMGNVFELLGIHLEEFLKFLEENFDWISF